MSRIPENKFDYKDSPTVISLLINERSASNLRKFDISGISDPVTPKTKFDKHEQTMRHFEDTGTRDQEVRYEVALTWVINHSCLQSYRTLLKSVSLVLAEN
ncbi:hypothetical protein NPIL_606691 [Nephila pilipes]|uniref:Uncharacterized protein n=1 Tax=Nephila pilipes TaxID=299642 RepID=A0A8X6NIP2_NEPPI|nr:hypothetical protein NPIL_606691 [Nephila pilipes]